MFSCNVLLQSWDRRHHTQVLKAGRGLTNGVHTETVTSQLSVSENLGGYSAWRMCCSVKE